MTTAPTGAERGDRLRSTARFLTAVLAVAALVLAVLVWQAVAGGPTVAAEPGDKVALRTEPYGREVTVLLPGSEVTVRVGAPVQDLGYDLLEVEYDDPRWDARQDLAAPDDGALVPVTWHVRALGGFSREADPNPIEIRLVAGDERVTLDSVVLGDPSDSLDAADPTSVAVGLRGRPGPDDLDIEVEYDGQTQTAHVASGKIDAGAAQPLYEDGRAVTAGCTEVESACALTASPRSPLRPDGADFTASHVSLYPYDATLGWADEGTLWAGLRLQFFGTDNVQDAAGEIWFSRRQSAPVVTLDGAKPVRREGLKAGTFTSFGRVVFQVDAETLPRELAIDQVLSLRGPGAPGDLPLHARLVLTPVT